MEKIKTGEILQLEKIPGYNYFKMNKERRRELGRLKQKKRVKQNLHVNIDSLPDEEKHKLHIYKTTGKPCSCAMCSPGKIEDKKEPDLDIEGQLQDFEDRYNDC